MLTYPSDFDQTLWASVEHNVTFFEITPYLTLIKNNLKEVKDRNKELEETLKIMELRMSVMENKLEIEKQKNGKK